MYLAEINLIHLFLFCFLVCAYYGSPFSFAFAANEAVTAYTELIL